MTQRTPTAIRGTVRMPATRLVRRLRIVALAVLVALVPLLVAAPRAIAAPLPAGSYLFAGIDPGNTSALAVIDRVSGATVATVPLDLPNDIVTNLASASVYAAVDNTVVVVDPSTATITRTITSDKNDAYVSLAVTPDGRRVYVLDNVANVVDVYDVGSGTRIVRLRVLAGANELAMTPDGSQVWVVYGTTTVSVIGNDATPAVDATVTVSVDSQELVFDPRGTTAYLLGDSGAVAAVDVATRTVTARWAVNDFQPYSLAVSPDGSRLFETGADLAGTGQLIVVDTATGATLRTIATGYPLVYHPQFSADGKTAYLPEGGQVLAVDTTAFTTRAIPGPVTAIALVDLTAPVFESSSSATFTAGIAGSASVVTTAFPKAALSVSGTLPAGITFADKGDGTGTFSGTTTTPGTYPVTVTAKNTVGQTTQGFTLTVVAGSPATIQAVAGGDQAAAPGAFFTTQPKAVLKDAYGNPVPGASVTFAVSPAGAASFAGVTTYTAPTLADGTVESPLVLAGSTPGPVTVTATYAGLPAASFPLTIEGPTPGAPTIGTVTPADGSAQVAFTPGVPGTSPTTGYLVTATDVTDASRGGQTAQGSGSPITVTGLTNGDTYTFTVTALSAGGNSAPSGASQPVVIGVPKPPGAPTIDSLSTGDGYVQVTFTPGASGGGPTTGYLVTATDATNPARGGQIAQGTASPITVTGLTNADAYSFTVTALSTAGNSQPSTASALINVGVPSTLSGTPTPGTAGRSYSYRFSVTGVPLPTLTTSGTLPPGLTLDQDGLLHGTPTTPGSYPFIVLAANGVGQDSVTPTVVIGTGELGGVEPTTTPPTTTTTTTTPPGPTDTSTPPPASGVTVAGSDAYGSTSYAGSSMPRTGTPAGWLLAIAAALVLGGAVAVVSTRRRRTGDGA